MVFGLRSVFEYDFLAGDPESLLIRLVGEGVRPLIAVSEKFRSIFARLIAYSGSMESAKAMKRFVQMRLWPGAELKIVTFHPSDDKAHELLRAAEDYCRAHGFRVCHQSNPGDPKSSAGGGDVVAGRHDRDGEQRSQRAAAEGPGRHAARDAPRHADSAVSCHSEVHPRSPCLLQ